MKKPPMPVFNARKPTPAKQFIPLYRTVNLANPPQAAVTGTKAA